MAIPKQALAHYELLHDFFYLQGTSLVFDWTSTTNGQSCPMGCTQRRRN